MSLKTFIKPFPIKWKHILSTYCEDCKNLFWKYGNVSKKLTKRRDDLEFLNLCKIYGLTPKFVRFKIYKRTLQNTKFYKSLQNKLLINEIKTCKNDIKKLTNEVDIFSSQLRTIVNFFDYLLICKFFRFRNKNYSGNVKATYQRKLRNLGAEHDLSPCNPDHVVHNYSSVSVSPRTKTLLA